MNFLFRKQSKINFKEMGIISFLFILIIIFSLLSPYFFEVGNLLNILRQISLTGIMAIGMTMILVNGEIDLSIGAVYGLAAIVTGYLMTVNVPIWLCIIIGLVSGLVVGFINGFLVTYVRIPAIIATLGMMYVARGSALLFTNGIPVVISKRTVSNPNLSKFLTLGDGQVFGFIPVMAFFLIVIAIIGYIYFHKTIHGFHMRASGGNANAAIASGISVRKVKIQAYIITGLLSAFAGILNLAFLTNVRADSGTGIEMTVIAAVVLGGTSLNGGKGTILGSIIGVLIIGVLKNGLILLGISPFWQVLLIGIVIIVAVAMDVWKGSKKI